MKLRLQSKYTLIILSIAVFVAVTLGGGILIQFKLTLQEITRSHSKTLKQELMESQWGN